VTGVVYRNGRRGGEERVPCSAVVLAAGAINTTRILLESHTAAFPSGLGDTEGVLGRYLHDHPAGKIILDLGRPLSIRPPAYLARPSLDQTEPLYATACTQWSGVEIVARSIVSRHPGKLRWIGFSIFGTMAPTRDNGVFLDADNRLPDGTPGVKLHIRHPGEARTTLEKARDELKDLFGRAGYAPTMRVWKIENPGNSNHYGGTCRMHESPRYGMLDAWNRLHAVPNVAVVDSAAFTTGPEKNPVLTAMALAARAGDRLALDLRSGTV
jgi:choline dehydrogenase-like flavoprotein